MNLLQQAAYLSLVLLVVGFVVAFLAATPCPCACGSTTQQHSPLRRH